MNGPQRLDTLASINLADMPPMDVVDYGVTAADYDFLHQADVAGMAGIDLSHTVEPQDPFGLRTRNTTDRFAGVNAGMPAPYALPRPGVEAPSDFKVSVPTAESMAQAEEAKFLSYAVDAAKVAVNAFVEKQEAAKLEQAAATHQAVVAKQAEQVQRFLIDEEVESKQVA